MIKVKFGQIAVVKVSGEAPRLYGLDYDGQVWAKILTEDLAKDWIPIEGPERMEPFPDTPNAFVKGDK